VENTGTKNTLEEQIRAEQTSPFIRKPPSGATDGGQGAFTSPKRHGQTDFADNMERGAALRDQVRAEQTDSAFVPKAQPAAMDTDLQIRTADKLSGAIKSSEEERA
jgi:hypothetical protein